MSLNFYVRVRSASNLLQRCQHQLKACAYMLQLKGQTQRNFGLSQHSWIPNKSKSFSLRITPATKPNGSSESTRKVSGGSDSVLKLYVTRDSPLSVAVEACLKYLKLEYETVWINLERGDLFSLHFLQVNKRKPNFTSPEISIRRIFLLQKNPNGEVPCLDDNEFFVSESAAILQYLADKYKKNETFYPWNPQQRARINQLLAFNNTTLYRAIMDYWVNCQLLNYVAMSDCCHNSWYQCVAGLHYIFRVPEIGIEPEEDEPRCQSIQ